MYDLVVIGGGAGGIETALAAAEVGARVALIEKGEIGGQRTYSAGVPSKALLWAARVARDVRNAPSLGITTGSCSVDFAAVMNRIRQTIHEAARRQTAADLQKQGVEIIKGTAAFEAYDTVLVDGKTTINARRFVIATGSRTAVPEWPGLTEAGYLDTTSVWSLNTLPESLLVLGARPEAIEFAQAFARLGSRVILLTDAPQLLPGEDADAVAALTRALEADGVDVRVGAQIGGVRARSGKKIVTYRDASNPDPVEAGADHLLLAAGRWANVEGLELHRLHIEAEPESGVEVNEYLQTYAPNIFAVGDVIGHHRWAHAAEREAAVAFQNAILRLPRKLDYHAIPRVTFTDPEFAAVGLTEEEAHTQDPQAQVYRMDPSRLDRAVIEAAGPGLAKVVVSGSGKVLGAVVVCPNASLVLQEFVLAMEKGLSLSALVETIHPSPTYLGVVQDLARQYQGHKNQSNVLRAAMKWFHGFQERKAGAVPDRDAPLLAAAEPHGHETHH